MLKYGFLVLSLFVFLGCAVKTPFVSSKAYHIVIKNLKFAVADVGFIKKDASRFNIQVFSASTPILDLHVEDMVCLDSICLQKNSFNREFFGTVHYETFIDELFKFLPIYNQKNIKRNVEGFEQKIKTENYDIIYKVEGNNLYFKDRKNKILIKFRELKK